jgi:hypothetical protein
LGSGAAAGAAIVVDIGAARGAGGVEGAAWDAAEISEVGDEGVAQVLAVGPPRVVV